MTAGPGARLPADPARNAELAWRFVDALSAGDVDGAVALLGAEPVWTFPGHDHALAGVHRGPAAVRGFAGDVGRLTAGTFSLELHEIYGGPSGAVVSFTGHGTRPDGRVLDNPTRLQMVIENGRIAELVEFVWDVEAVSAFWR